MNIQKKSMFNIGVAHRQKNVPPADVFFWSFPSCLLFDETFSRNCNKKQSLIQLLEFYFSRLRVLHQTTIMFLPLMELWPRFPFKAYRISTFHFGLLIFFCITFSSTIKEVQCAKNKSKADVPLSSRKIC